MVAHLQLLVSVRIPGIQTVEHRGHRFEQRVIVLLQSDQRLPPFQSQVPSPATGAPPSERWKRPSRTRLGSASRCFRSRTDAGRLREVQIAQYLREHSTPADTVYAAHNFPVLAFYSERRTVSLLPNSGRFRAPVARADVAQVLRLFPAGAHRRNTWPACAQTGSRIPGGTWQLRGG